MEFEFGDPNEQSEEVKTESQAILNSEWLVELSPDIKEGFKIFTQDNVSPKGNKAIVLAVTSTGEGFSISGSGNYFDVLSHMVESHNFIVKHGGVENLTAFINSVITYIAIMIEEIGEDKLFELLNKAKSCPCPKHVNITALHFRTSAMAILTSPKTTKEEKDMVLKSIASMNIANKLEDVLGHIRKVVEEKNKKNCSGTDSDSTH